MKKFLKLNVNMDIARKNVKLAELNIKNATASLNTYIYIWLNKIKMFVF